MPVPIRRAIPSRVHLLSNVFSGDPKFRVVDHSGLGRPGCMPSVYGNPKPMGRCSSIENGPEVIGGTEEDQCVGGCMTIAKVVIFGMNGPTRTRTWDQMDYESAKTKIAGSRTKTQPNAQSTLSLSRVNAY